MTRFKIVLLALAALVTLPSVTATNSSDVQVDFFWDPSEVASAAEWAEAIEKGNRLNCRLDANDEAAGRLWEDTRNPPSARSQWTDTTLQTDLKTWSWYPGYYEQELHCDFADDDSNGHANKIGTAMQALGVSAKPRAEGGDIKCFNYQHYNEEAEDEEGGILEPEDQYYDVSGETYRCTGAHVRFGINHHGGMIIGLDFESPKASAEELWGQTPTEDELPRLKRVSEIMTAFWLRDNPDPKKLKHYLVYNVQNEQTMALIKKVVDDSGLRQVPYWPGVTVGMWQEAGEALLGSPLGSTLAFVLAQHKVELGMKHVTQITIFRDNFAQSMQPSIQLLFRIKDVPNPGEDSLRARHVGPRDMIRTHKIGARQAFR